MTLTVSRDLEQEVSTVAVTDLVIPPVRTFRPSARADRTRPLVDIVEEWGMQSFPASDPPANW